MKNAEPKKVGRPTKRTEALVGCLCEHLEGGASYRAASYLAGINPETFHRWVKEDAEFSNRVHTARATAVAKWAKAMVESGDWRAKAWLLERLEYDDWGPKQRIEHTGKDGEKLTLAWAWETASENGKNGNSPTAASHAGNGSSLRGEVPCSRLRETVGENGA